MVNSLQNQITFNKFDDNKRLLLGRFKIFRLIPIPIVTINIYTDLSLFRRKKYIYKFSATKYLLKCYSHITPVLFLFHLKRSIYLAIEFSTTTNLYSSMNLFLFLWFVVCLLRRKNVHKHIYDDTCHQHKINSHTSTMINSWI